MNWRSQSSAPACKMPVSPPTRWKNSYCRTPLVAAATRLGWRPLRRDCPSMSPGSASTGNARAVLTRSCWPAPWSKAVPPRWCWLAVPKAIRAARCGFGQTRRAARPSPMTHRPFPPGQPATPRCTRRRRTSPRVSASAAWRKTPLPWPRIKRRDLPRWPRLCRCKATTATALPAH